jgi:GT2 family glycosyltransferase
VTSYAVVIPTLGRPCLQACLDALAAADGPLPRQIVLADDRRDTPDPLPVVVPEAFADRTVVVTLEGRGPAAARNAGWRAAEPADWVAFLDDDVRVGPDWRAALAADLASLPDRVAGVQGVIDVPLPAGRRPTDWSRGPSGRMPTWPCACSTWAGSCAAARGGPPTRSGPRPAGPA